VIGFGRSTKSPIGIDTGSRHLRAVQVRPIDRGSWRIEAATSIPRQTPDCPLTQEEVFQFATLLDRQGFTGRDVVLAVPDKVLLSDILKLPSRASGVPLEQIARMEIARIHKREPGSFEMASWDLPSIGRHTNETQVMAAACPHEDSDKLLDMFEAANLNVIALDTAAWSIARACASLLPAEPGITGILDLGWNLARLVVLHGGVVVYERTIAEGGIKTLHDAVITRTGIDPDAIDLLLLEMTASPHDARRSNDANSVAALQTLVTAYADSLAGELKKSFSYASHRYNQSENQQLLLVGDGACLPSISGRVADAAGLVMRSVSAAELVQCPDHMIQACHTPALTKALGLAMHNDKSRCDDSH